MRNLTKLALLLALGLLPAAALAGDYQSGDLKIENTRARATPPGAKVAGGYMLIRNGGDTTDRLVGGTTPAAERLEVHEMAIRDGIMKMRPLSDGLEIPAGGEVALKPGGYHIMLIGLKEQLKEGAEVPATLTFARAGSVDVMLNVVPIGSTDGMGKNDMPDSGMHRNGMRK